MLIRKFSFSLVFATIFCFIIILNTESKSVQNNFHSDAIVTHWPAPDPKSKVGAEEDEPGFMRRQLLKFGEVASRVGNAMGAHASKITSAVDKVCEIVKTIVPLLAAICHVGQFKFCAATTEAPGQLDAALNPTGLDLNIPD